MDAFFSNSNAHAYSGGFTASDSDSGGASAGSTPTMGDDFTSFDAGAAWASNANSYQPRVGFDGSGHHAPLGTLNAYGGPVQQQPRVAPPPSPFDFNPENPFEDLFEDMQRNARNAAQMQVPGPLPPAYQDQHPYHAPVFYHGFGAGPYGPPAMNLGYAGFAPPAASYFTPPAANFSMQQPVDVQYGTPATNMGYAGLAPPAVFHPPAPAANSNTQHVQRYDLRFVGVELPGVTPDAGAVESEGIASPPPRGRKGKAAAGKSKARAGRARKHKEVQSSAPSSPVAGPSHVDDGGARGWRDLDAQNGVLPSFLALQNADIGIPHAPLAPSEEGAYPGGDVQDNGNNTITRGQSQGSSAGGKAAASRSRAARTAPGVTKDAPRDEQDRLKIHAPVANPQPPVKGNAVPVFEPAPRGKTQYCRECWEAGDLVYWQDDAGLKKHCRDKHSEERGESSVPHKCIFECGFSKCSTRAEHFIKHRKARGGKTDCKPYHELEANGGVQGFLIQRGLQGHWQLGKAKAKPKKGGRRQVMEEDEDSDTDDEDDDE